MFSIFFSNVHCANIDSKALGESKERTQSRLDAEYIAEIVAATILRELQGSGKMDSLRSSNEDFAGNDNYFDKRREKKLRPFHLV